VLVSAAVLVLAAVIVVVLVSSGGSSDRPERLAAAALAGELSNNRYGPARTLLQGMSPARGTVAVVLASQPGLPVHGKTGTAETGNGTPPRTDAWFVGYQGDIAFAALVANTANGFGGAVAAPIVGRFLATLQP
jgi:hypothetical protein